MRYPPMRHWPVAIVAAGCALLTSCADHAAADDRSCSVTVTATIVGPDGKTTGGSFAVIEPDTGEVMVCGQVDLSGEIDFPVDVPAGMDALCLVVGSVGMLRRGPDEWWLLNSEPRGSNSSLMVELWKSRWHRGDDGSLADYVRAKPGDFADLVPYSGGRDVRYVVKRTLRMESSRDGKFDVGEIRFRVRKAFAELNVALQDASGRPIPGGASLTGFPLNRRTVYGNRFYPHFAVGKTIDGVRIIMSRAGWRLMMANDGNVLRLRTGGGEANVTLEAGELERMHHFETSLRARCVVGSDEPLTEFVELVLPEFWSLGEPGL